MRVETMCVRAARTLPGFLETCAASGSRASTRDLTTSWFALADATRTWHILCAHFAARFRTPRRAASP